MGLNPRMVKLWKKVDKFNEIVKQLEVAEKLEEAGNEIGFKRNKSQFIGALQETRKNLKTALETDSIFRDNPKFTPSNFSFELENLNNHDVNEKGA